jgi:hypothetical protein
MPFDSQGKHRMNPQLAKMHDAPPALAAPEVETPKSVEVTQQPDGTYSCPVESATTK